MIMKILRAIGLGLCCLLPCFAARAVVIEDNFTGTSSANTWILPTPGDGTTNTACMTAGNGTGSIPKCTTITDSSGSGALRLTDATNNQHGGIVSNFTFGSTAGVQVTFTTYTYGGTGADGMNFFLMDGSVTPTMGGTGGSLGYSCSNVNDGYNGVIGGYIGLGIDEYGNYLNPSDNTLTGPGFKAGRIGLRGAGNINWTWLNANYPSYYPSTVTSTTYQKAAVKATCKSGYLQQGTASSYTWTWSSTSTSDSALLQNYCASILTYSALNNYNSTDYPTTRSVGSSDQANAVSRTCSTGYIQKGTKSGSSWSWASTSTLLSSTTLLTNACSNLSYANLTSYNSSDYPSTVSSTSDQHAAISQTCSTGYLQAGTQSVASNASWTWSSTSTKLADYPVFTDSSNNYIGYSILSSSTPIGSSATKRTNATPISYKLKITQDGYLSLWYSYNGGVYQSVLTNQSITSSNGTLPSTLRFGFTGSTGGSNNVHEITCFQATPTNIASGSAGLNVESGQIKTGTQVYLAYYHTDNWWGQVTSQNLTYDSSTDTASISGTPNWDASCVLTGGDCSSTGATGMTAQSSANRNILTWNGTQGIPFTWTSSSTSLSSAQQAALNDVDYEGIKRVAYLRGDRTNEITSSGDGLFRARTGVLADVIDSSPTWVGPPQTAYPTASQSTQTTWGDALHSTSTMLENGSSAQTYGSFQTSYATRQNLVYVGANDGLLHAFRAGAYDASGNYVANSTTPNDGYEMLAYIPSAIVSTIHSGSNTGVDFSSSQYGHLYSVDAAPGTGDLFYNNKWHTWLVGGLGAGGNAIYALDITDPSKFSESNASSLVIGEWSSSDLPYLGQTYGIPQIRRFHNGQWGAVFGNGLYSSSGVAGIYIMLVDSSGTVSFKFLSTGSGTSSNKNGIAFATPADLDGDHVVDYVYAGDMYGQVWRFDLTSTDSTNWAASSSPIFKTDSGQPISTKVLVATLTAASTNARVMLIFGTGNKIPQSLTDAASFATTTQDFYGVWDWNMSGWNAISSTQFSSLTGQTAPLGKTNLTQQTITTSGSFRTVSSNTVCWQGTTVCTGSNSKFGWYMDLPSTTAGGVTVYEQVIYSPIIANGAFIVNTTIPETNTPLTCNSSSATGWTMAVSPASGGTLATSFFNLSLNGVYVSGEALNGVGSPSVVSAKGSLFLVMQALVGSSSTLSSAAGDALTVSSTGASVTTVASGSGNGCVGDECGSVTKITINQGSLGRVNWVQLR